MYNNKFSFTSVLLGLLVFLSLFEASLLTIKRQLIFTGNHRSAAFFLLISLLFIGVAALLAAKKPAIQAIKYRIANVRGGFMLATVFGGLTIVLGHFSRIIAENPVDAKASDIIPALKIYITRLFAGENVYAPYDGWGYTWYPNYMPLSWLPFSFGEYFSFDYRWVAMGMLLMVLAFYLMKIYKSKISDIGVTILAAMPFVFLYWAMLHEFTIAAYTTEWLIAAYYLWAVAAILYARKPWVIALALVGCLMSRYTLVLWLPAFFLILWRAQSFKSALTIGLWMFGLVMAVYVVPFFLRDPDGIIRGFKYYMSAAIGEWYPQGWQAPGSKPFHLFRGLGFAGAFYDFWPGALEDKLAATRKYHAIATFASAIIPALLYIFTKLKDKIDFRLFAIISFKLYVVIFFTFIHVPYSYLFVTSIFMSFVIVYELWMRHSATESAN